MIPPQKTPQEVEAERLKRLAEMYKKLHPTPPTQNNLSVKGTPGGSVKPQPTTAGKSGIPNTARFGPPPGSLLPNNQPKEIRPEDSPYAPTMQKPQTQPQDLPFLPVIMKTEPKTVLPKPQQAESERMSGLAGLFGAQEHAPVFNPNPEPQPMQPPSPTQPQDQTLPQPPTGEQPKQALETPAVPWTSLGFGSDEEGMQWASAFAAQNGYWPWEGSGASWEENMANALGQFFGGGVGLEQQASGGGGFGGFFMGGGSGHGYGGGEGSPAYPPFWWPWQARGI